MQVFKELKSVRSSRKRVTEPNFPGLAIPFPPVVERKRKKKKKPGGRRKGGRYLGLNEILLFSKICNMIFSLSHRQFLSCSEVRTIVNFDT